MAGEEKKTLSSALAANDEGRDPSSEILASARRAAVLVIDDEPAVGAVLGRVLRDHDVTVVTKAKDALALLAAGKHFDVILSDLMMPQMSGMDLYDELATRDPSAARRVVFMTGGIFSPEVSEFLDRVANERITKPLSVEAVRSLVHRLLKE